MIRTVLGDRPAVTGTVYCHEHLIIDSPLIHDRFPHIHLHSVDAAVAELDRCRAAGVTTMVDCMPMAAGRVVERLAAIAARTGVDLVAATGLHHDRYYGALHWSNQLGAEELAGLFVADLVEGIDRFDCTGPVVRRTRYRAGLIKVATSGARLDARDRRNLEAAAAASVRTGAPIVTHCEGGAGALQQLRVLGDLGVPASAVITSHVDKTGDLGYLAEIAGAGAFVECDQALRQHAAGSDAPAIGLLCGLAELGLAGQVLVGTDGARRTLWTSLGGEPGLAWLASTLPGLLAEHGMPADQIALIMGVNAARALCWRPAC